MFPPLLAEGLLLGLAVGVSCLATCAPVYAPLLALRQSDWRLGLWIILALSAGRFRLLLARLRHRQHGAAFGLAAGQAGRLLADQALARHVLLILSYAGLSLYLLFTAFVQLRREQNACAFRRLERFSGNPFLVGILTGSSICPAFLLALARGFEASGAFGGLSLFLGFFFGTPLYLLPLALLSLASKRKWFRLAAVAASALVAAWYLWRAVVMAYFLIASYR